MLGGRAPRAVRCAAVITLTVALLCGAWVKASPVRAAPPYTQLILHVNLTTTIVLTLITNSTCSLVNSGTDWAAVDLGTANKTAGTSCATYAAGNTYTLTTSLAVEATCTGTCTNWNLTAALKSAAQTGTTWRLGAVNLTTTAAAITSNIAYNTATNEAFRLSVKTNGAAAPTGALQQEIVFTATANGGSGATATATLNAESINEPGISIFFVQDASGAPVTGGAFDAALNFGNVSAYGALPAGVTRPTVTALNYTLQTLVDIDVESGGIVSSNYTMQAALAAAAPTGITYAVNGVTLTTTAATVTSTGTYGSNEAYTLLLTVLTAASGAGGPTVGSPISSTIDFTATAN